MEFIFCMQIMSKYLQFDIILFDGSGHVKSTQNKSC